VRSREESVREYEPGRFAMKSSIDWYEKVPPTFDAFRDLFRERVTDWPNFN